MATADPEDTLYARSVRAAGSFIDLLDQLLVLGEDGMTGAALTYRIYDPKTAGKKSTYPLLYISYGPERLELADLGLGKWDGADTLLIGTDGDKPGFHSPTLMVAMKEGVYDVTFCRLAGIDLLQGEIYKPGDTFHYLDLAGLHGKFSDWLAETGAGRRRDFNAVMQPEPARPGVSPKGSSTRASELATGWPRLRQAANWLASMASRFG